MSMSEQALSIILSMDHPELKGLLLFNLNRSASNVSMLYAKDYDSPDRLDLIKLMTQDEVNLLTIFFLSASKELITEAQPFFETLSSDELIHLLSNQFNQRLQINRRSNYANNSRGLTGSSMDIDSQPASLDPCLFIDFMQLQSSDSSILAVLNILKLLPCDQQFLLFHGASEQPTLLSSRPTLLHLLFKTKNKTIIDLTLEMLEKFPPAQSSELLKIIHEDQTALQLASQNQLFTKNMRTQLESKVSLSSIEIAIENQQFETAIELISNPQSDLWTPDSCKAKLLLKIIHSNHYDLIKSTLDSFELNVSINSRAQAWSMILQPKHQEIIGFNHAPFTLFFKELKNTISRYDLRTIFQNYCLAQQEWTGLFLIKLATLINIYPSEVLFDQTLLFIKNRLRIAQFSTINDQAPLIILLFSLNAESRNMLLALCLKQIEDPEDIAKFRSLIFRVITTPAIYSRLTTEEHQTLHQLINNRESINELAHHYFQHADLSLMPPGIIQLYSAALNGNDLDKHIGKRISPALNIILLEHAIKTSEHHIEQLSMQLYGTLELFNSIKSNLRNNELFHMLNLIQFEPIKKQVRDYLLMHPKDALIHERITALFPDFSNEFELLPNSLLDEFFIERVTDSSERGLHARDCYLRQIPADRFTILLDKHSQRLHAQSKPDFMARTTSLIREATEGLELKPLYIMARQIAHELGSFCEFINGFNQKLHEELSHFQNGLGLVIQRMERIQLSTTFLEWADELIAITDEFRNHHEHMQAFLHEENKLFDLEQNDPMAYKGLSDLIDRRVLTLLNTLSSICEQKRRKQETNEPFLVSSPDLNNQIIEINRGILSNPQINKLLPQLLHWQLQLGHLTSFKSSIDHASFFLSLCDTQTIDQIINQQNPVIMLGKHCSPLIKQLEQCNNPLEFVHCLIASPESILTLFVDLTEQSRQQDLYHLSLFAIAARKNPVRIDDKINALFSDALAKYQIQKSLSDLQHYLQEVARLGDLFIGLYIDQKQCLMRLEALEQRLEGQNRVLQSSDLDWIILSHSELLESGLQSPQTQKIIALLGQTLKQSPLPLQIRIINQFSPVLIRQITSHCIRGLGVNDSTYRECCQLLLRTLCQHTTDTSTLQQIKTLLGQQDLDTLSQGNLQQLAQTLLADTSNLQDLTFDGAWIQRLLLSPKFIAQSTPAIIHQLTERYRALSLTLKQDEYERLHAFLSNKLQFSDEYKAAWTQLTHAIQSSPESRARLYDKLARLLAFRADDCIRALFNQLEDHCLKHQFQNKAEAEAALAVLYQYYGEQVQSLRSGFLFKLSDYIYSHAVRNKGDLRINNNRLLGWLEQNLPHYNFAEHELQRKSQVKLFDPNGSQIGFINESNEAVQFKNRELVCLLHIKGFDPGYIFYDKNRRRIGTLSITGKVHIENLFQQNTAALVVAKMPLQELEYSKAACYLLFQDIIQEDALEIVYANNLDAEKRSWIARQIVHHLKTFDTTLTSEHTTLLVENHDVESILLMLEKSKNKANIQTLFISLLQSPSHREFILHPARLKRMSRLLDELPADKLLLTFLTQFHQERWFAEGLRLFARFAHTKKQPELLCKALTLLQINKNTGLLTKNTYDLILSTLLTDELVAGLILNHFIPNQWYFFSDEERLTHFFYKQHLLAGIRYLNEHSSWHESQVYLLLLTILDKEYQGLFPRHEPRFSKNIGWHEDDIILMHQFILKHLKSDNNSERSAAITLKILGELVFRAANYGLTRFFYNAKETIETQIALGTIQQDLFKRKNPEPFANRAADLITNWDRQAEEAFQLANSQRLPFISAFLLNYSGSTESLVTLLDQLLANPQIITAPDYLNVLTSLIRQTPHRMVSKVVFQALLRTLSQTPSLMTPDIFNDLTCYHHRLTNNTATLPGKIAFLRFLGEQKSYSLIRTCVAMLFTTETVRPRSEFYKNLKTIDRIARVEQALSPHQNSWYFVFLKFFKRLWHYGITRLDDKNQLLRYCDNTQAPTRSNAIPDRIETRLREGQHFDKQITYDESKSALETRIVAFDRRYVPIKPSNSGIFSSSRIVVEFSDSESDNELQI